MFTLAYDDTGLALPGEAQHATTARHRAMGAARDSGRAIRMLRGGRAYLVIDPDGLAYAPEGLTDCKAGTGRPACFCLNCRARRR